MEVFDFIGFIEYMSNVHVFKHTCINTYFLIYLLGLLKSDKANSVDSLPELLTSDSEGSCAGVGSPRDLQSPDFTTGFHSDKFEVCFYFSIKVLFLNFKI